jgi:hypothetical protein
MTPRTLALVAVMLVAGDASAEPAIDPLVAQMFTTGTSWTFAGTIRTISWEDPEGSVDGPARKRTRVEKLRVTCRVATVRRFPSGAATKIDCPTDKDKPFIIRGIYLATRRGLHGVDRLPATDRELTDASRDEPLLPLPARSRVKKKKDADTQYTYRAVRRVLRAGGKRVTAWCGSIDGGVAVDGHLVDPGGYEICFGDGRPLRVRSSDRSAITVEMEASLL